jgi:lactam utilization protein B
MSDRDATIVALSSEEMIRLEVICVDGDRDGALAFLRDMRTRIRQTTIKGMKSHLDS